MGDFHLGHADWVRLLRIEGFKDLDLIELQPAAVQVTGPLVVVRLAERPV